MKIGFAQFSPVFGEVETNIKTMEHLIATSKADLLVFPELATTGYTFTSKDEVRSLSEPFETSESLNRLHAIATESSCAVVVGFAEKSEEGMFNSATFLKPDGTKALYRKIHLYGSENIFFQPGNIPFKVYDYKDIKLGMIVCFDWYFPESIRVLALKGAQIICQPANLILPWCQSAMLIRSIENRVFTITANRYGSEVRGEYSFTFTGESQIISPDGDVLAKAPKDNDFVAVLEIDPSEALNKKINEHNDLFKDRHSDFYSEITKR